MKNKKALLPHLAAVLTGGIVLLGAASQNFLYAKEEPPRAMWTWDVKVPASPDSALGLIDFCQSKNVSLIYLAALNFNDNAKASYRFFNALAHRNNVKVHALAGDPRWCIEKYHGQPMEWVAKVLEYNRASKPEERFDGIHVDAEPYVLGKVWEQNREMLLKWYLDLNRKIADLLELENEDIVFGSDIPFWYDDDITMKVEWQGVTKPPSYHILDTIDTVTVMDYRNFTEGPNGSIALVSFEMEYAGKIGKKVYIGQETKPDVYPEYITFGVLDEATMETEIKKLVDAYKDSPAFAGVAIHHYRSYKELVNKGK